ncbi:hypothetical protein [Aquimarina algiphila]|uniref:hypothetical protein n=1 Tax=Aquimarina algiphila TaxID=2047982 RepID=UPI00232F120A|nr:hypothetical protein [Aquimarina algiphila]
MNAREQSLNMSLCHKNGIKIYPIVYAKHKYKLVIERNGVPKMGNVVYPQETEFDKKTKEIIKLNVYEQIHSLYDEMAIKIKENLNKKSNNNLNQNLT